MGKMTIPKYSTRYMALWLALGCTLFITLPNFIWIPISIETVGRDGVTDFWVSFAFRFLCLLGLFWSQLLFNFKRLGSIVLSQRIGQNIVFTLAFSILFWIVSAIIPPFHINGHVGKVLIFQFLMLSLICLLSGYIYSLKQPVTSLITTEKTTTYQDKLLVPIHDKILPIDLKEVMAFYTSNNTTLILLRDGKQLEYKKTLQQISQTLDPSNFFRANKQFIVSRDGVKDLTIWFDSRLLVKLMVETPEPLYVSKNKAGEFKKWLSVE